MKIATPAGRTMAGGDAAGLSGTTEPARARDLFGRRSPPADAPVADAAERNRVEGPAWSRPGSAAAARSGLLAFWIAFLTGSVVLFGGYAFASILV